MTTEYQRSSVFSTYVEVILAEQAGIKIAKSILHVCGGDPLQSRDTGKSRTVFSTYVEVIPITATNSGLMIGILHVCGCIAILGFLKKS